MHLPERTIWIKKNILLQKFCQRIQNIQRFCKLIFGLLIVAQIIFFKILLLKELCIIFLHSDPLIQIVKINVNSLYLESDGAKSHKLMLFFFIYFFKGRWDLLRLVFFRILSTSLKILYLQFLSNDKLNLALCWKNGIRK